MIMVVVNRFTKLANYIPIKTQDSCTVAQASAYLENVWKYPGFP